MAAAALARLWRAREQRLGGQGVVRGELRAGQAEPARDDPVHRPLEDAQLGGAVVLEGSVTVEMIRGEVEQHGDLERELVDVLELERRELADDPCVLEAGSSDVSGRPTFPPTATSRPAARKIAPRSSVVVVFPFVPVTPMNGRGRSRR